MPLPFGRGDAISSLKIDSSKYSLSRYAALRVRRGGPARTGRCDECGGQWERGGSIAGAFAGPDGFSQSSVVFLARLVLPRKEVIQPHLPVRLPCYDFTPLTLHTFGASPLAVGPATSGADDSGGVTGGVYKARERIHRGVLIRDY